MNFARTFYRLAQKPRSDVKIQFIHSVRQCSYVNASNERRVPVSPDLQNDLLKTPPEKLSDARLLQVAVIGLPNAGKSTLINRLVGWNICTVSKKVHTTRKLARAMFVEDETQVVFLDTPGCVDPDESRKYQLETSFIIDPEKALMQSDLLLVLHDVSKKYSRRCLNPKILRLLHLYPEKQSILVLNKIDRIKEKRKLLDLSQILTCGVIGGEKMRTESSRPVLRTSAERLQLSDLVKMSDKQSLLSETKSEEEKMETAIQTRNLSEKQLQEVIEGRLGWPGFSQLFMISALEGDGTEDIRDFLIKAARPARWLYHSAVVTDQNPHNLALGVLKSQLLETLPHEVPYKCQVSIIYWDVTPSGALNIVFQVMCPAPRLVPIIVGFEGVNVSILSQKTESQLRNVFQCDVKIKIDVTSPHRRNS